MRRVNNIYDSILDIKVIQKIYSSRVRVNTKNKLKLEKFENNYVSNMIYIKQILEERNYKPGRYNIFLIKEPKLRIIMSQNIIDKIINHVVSQYFLINIFESTLIEENVATRKNKGTKYGIFLLKKYLNEVKDKNFYVLKFDISKYFFNLDHKIIKELLTVDLSNIYEITIREGDETIVILYNTGPININIHNLKNADNILLKDKDYHILKGKTYITTNIDKYKYIIEKDSFFQVNKYLTQKLYDKALEYLHPRDDDVLLDLYCGAGTIGIYLASSVERVIGIELNEYSIASANKNKILNNITNIKFINEDVAKAINKVKMATKVVVDPPRKGLDKNTINNIKRLYPARIIYISCNVHTLARDIKLLEDSYTLENYTIVDMFKGTYHTEIVSVLQRNNYEERF